jgi:hypothetical protein
MNDLGKTIGGPVSQGHSKTARRLRRRRGTLLHPTAEGLQDQEPVWHVPYWWKSIGAGIWIRERRRGDKRGGRSGKEDEMGNSQYRADADDVSDERDRERVGGAAIISAVTKKPTTTRVRGTEMTKLAHLLELLNTLIFLGLICYPFVQLTLQISIAM